MICPKTTSRAGMWFAIAVGITTASIVSSEQSANKRATANERAAAVAVAR